MPRFQTNKPDDDDDDVYDWLTKLRYETALCTDRVTDNEKILFSLP